VKKRGREMSNYWIRDNGQNTLKGVTGDFENPPLLPDHLILEFLSDGNQKARDDFQALLSSMLPEEQGRLETIYAYSTPPRKYTQTIEDDFQSSMTTRVNLGNNHLPKTVNKSTNKRTKLRVN
jgi:hypothetical protein